MKMGPSVGHFAVWVVHLQTDRAGFAVGVVSVKMGRSVGHFAVWMVHLQRDRSETAVGVVHLHTDLADFAVGVGPVKMGRSVGHLEFVPEQVLYQMDLVRRADSCCIAAYVPRHLLHFVGMMGGLRRTGRSVYRVEGERAYQNRNFAFLCCADDYVFIN